MNRSKRIPPADGSHGSDTRRRLRIAMVAACPFPAPQGSQVLIDQIARALSSRGHRVSLVTYPFGAGSSDLSIPYRIVRTLPLPGYGRLAPGPSPAKCLLDLALASALGRVVREQRIDLIHAHHFEGAAAGYLVRAATGTPVVFHGHSGLEDELPTYFTPAPAQALARRFGRWVDRQVPRRANARIAVSDDMRDLFVRSGAAPETTFTVPPGIDFPPAPAVERGTIEKKYGLPAGPKILYTGNLAPYQNLPLLFRAFSKVEREVPGAHLVIASHDRRVSEPWSWAGWAGRESIAAASPGPVSFIQDGSFDRIRTLLASVDVAVSLSSIRFGFPIKLLNYMAAGKAVLGSRISAKGLAHLEDAYLVGPDEGEIAEGLVRLLKDPALRARLGVQAMRKVAEEHDWDSIGERLERIYARVLHPGWVARIA